MKKMQERLGIVLYFVMVVLAVTYYPHHTEQPRRQSIALADASPQQTALGLQ